MHCRLILFTLTILLAGLISCGEPIDIPPGFEEDPVFRTVLLIDGQEVEFNAGINGYSVEASHKVDSNGIVVYKSSLSPLGCSSECGPAIALSILDADYAGSGNEGPEVVFSQPALEFTGPVIPETDLQVLAGIEQGQINFANVNWLLNNGSLLFGNEVEMTFEDGDPIQFCFSSSTALGCNYRQCIAVNTNAQNEACVTLVDVEAISSEIVKLTAQPQGSGPFSFIWNTGEISKSIIVHADSSNFFDYQLVVINESGCTNIISQTIPAWNGLVNNCQVPVNLEVFEIPVLQSPQFSSVEIEYTDGNGKKFVSSTMDQEGDAFFEILNAEPYNSSPSGDPTWLLDVRFSCTVYASDLTMKAIESTYTTLAVSVP